jgi:hypothetical protein
MTFPEPTHFRPPTVPPAQPLSQRTRAEEEARSQESVRRHLRSVRELVIDLLAAYQALETRAMRDADPELRADIDRIREIAAVDDIGRDIHAALAQALKEVELGRRKT